MLKKENKRWNRNEKFYGWKLEFTTSNLIQILCMFSCEKDKGYREILPIKLRLATTTTKIFFAQSDFDGV